MKKILTLMAVLATGSAFAQVSNFVGVSSAVNITSIKTEANPSPGSLMSDRAVGGNIQAAYGFELTPQTVLSLGATYGLSKDKAGGYVDSSETLNLKLKNQASIYLEPGFLLNPQTLVYGKVSYEQATLEATSSIPANSANQNVKGVGFGIGLRSMLDKNWFAQAELKQTKFGQETASDGSKLDVKNSVVAFGVGYKF